MAEKTNLSDYLIKEPNIIKTPESAERPVNPTWGTELVSKRDIKDYESYWDFNQIPLASPFLDDMRALNQSTADKWANGIVRAGVTAATTFSESLLDPVVGIPLAVATGDTSKIYDNKMTQVFDDLNNYMREAFPIHATEAYERATLGQKLGKANFWAEEFTQGLGFMAGAVGAVMATTGLANVTGFSKLAQKVYGNLSKGVRTGMSEMPELAQQVKALNTAVGASAKGVKGGKEFVAATASLLAATGESAIEARGVKDNIIQNLTARVAAGELDMTEEEITSQANQAANVAFAANMALVGGSNIVQFANIARGMVGVDDVLAGSTRMAGKGLGAKAIATPELPKALRIGWATLKNPLTEAAQEGGQFVTEKAMESVFGNYYDPEAGTEVNDYVKGMHRGLEETFGTTEGQTSMFLGALLGAMGMPGLGGGIYGDIQAINDKSKANEAIADTVNKLDFTKKLAALHKAATYNAASQNRKESLTSGDPFTVINEEMDHLKGYLLSMAKAGRLDIVEEHIQGLLEASEDVSTQSPTGTLSAWEEATGMKVKPANIEDFAEFMRNGMRQAERIVQETESYEDVHPDFALLMQDLMFNEYQNDELSKKAEKTISDIFSELGYVFDKSEFMKRDENGRIVGSPASNLNAMIASLKSKVGGLNPVQSERLNAAKGILLGAEGQKALIKAAYEYINSQKETDYSDLGKRLATKRKLFDQRMYDKSLKKDLVNSLDAEGNQLKDLFSNNTSVVDGEFFSSEFEIEHKRSSDVNQKFESWEETEGQALARKKKENDAAVAAGKTPPHDLNAPFERKNVRMKARFAPNGDILAVNPITGEAVRFPRIEANYALIDPSTINNVEEIVAKAHTTRLTAHITNLGTALASQIAETKQKSTQLKAELKDLKRQLLTVEKLKSKVPNELREEIGTALKKKAQIAKYLKEQIALREAEITVLDKVAIGMTEEVDLLREELILLRTTPMAVASYEKRIAGIAADNDTLNKEIADLRETVEIMRKLLREINSFLRRAAKITDPEILADESESFNAYLQNKYELFLPVGLDYFDSFAIKNKIGEIRTTIALLEKRADQLDNLEPVIRGILKKYKQARAQDKRRANLDRNRRQKELDDLKAFAKANPTTEIPDSHLIFKGGVEDPKGTISEVFSSTTGRWNEDTPQSKAWFKFTSEVTPAELEGMRLVPVIKENNPFEKFFEEQGITFFDESDIKLVLVDEGGVPVMRYGQPMTSSMPMARPNWLTTGEKRFQEVTPEEETRALAEHAVRREKIVASLKKGEKLEFRILGKRRGVPVLDEAYVGKLSPTQKEAFAVDPHKSVIGTLVETEEQIDTLELGVATDVPPGERGIQTVDTGEQAVLRAGAVFAKVNGTLVPMIKRRLTVSEANTVINLIRYHVSEYRKNKAIQDDPKIPNAQKTISRKMYGVIPGTAMRAKDYLKSILAFDNYNESEEFNIFFTSQNTLVFGKDEIDLNLLLDQDAITTEALEKFLLNKFHHVNKTMLPNKGEFASVEMDDQFKTKVTKHKSYKHYLVAPGGREQHQVPLGSWLVDYSPDVDNVQYRSVNLLMGYGATLTGISGGAAASVGISPSLGVTVNDELDVVVPDDVDALLGAMGEQEDQPGGEVKLPVPGSTGLTREQKIDWLMKNSDMVVAADVSELPDSEIDKWLDLTQKFIAEETGNAGPVSTGKGFSVVPTVSFDEETEETADKTAAPKKEASPTEDFETIFTDEKVPKEGAVLSEVEYQEALKNIPNEELFEKNADGTYTFKGFPFRKIQDATENIEIIPAEDLQEEFDWFTRTFSKEERIIITRIHAQGALGRITQSGEILIAPFTAAGTVYHEAFHLASNFYFTSKDQKALWNEWRERTGNTSATNMEAEEGLAEDFRRFAQSGGTILPKYKNKSLFQKLFDFLRNLVGGNRGIEKVFANIYSGKFASKRRSRTYSSVALNRMVSRVNLEDFRKAANIPGGEINEFIDSMNEVFMSAVFHTVNRVPKLYDPIKIIDGSIGVPIQGRGTMRSSELVYERVRAAYLQTLNAGLEKVRAGQATPAEKTTLRAINALVNKNWESTKLLHQEFFEQTGFFLNSKDIDVVIDTESGETVEDYREENKVESREPDWVTSVEIDPTRTIAKEVKLLLFGIKKRYLGTNDVQSNNIGLPKSSNVRELVLYLQNHLAESRTFPEMMQKVRELSKIRPELAEVMERMRVPLYGDTFTTADLAPHFKALQDAFFKQFARAKYDFEMLVKDREGDLSFFDSAADRNETRIVNSWKNNLNFVLAKNPSVSKVSGSGRVFDKNYKFSISGGRKMNYGELLASANKLSFWDKLQVFAQLGISFDAPSLVNPTVINENFGYVIQYLNSEPPISGLFRQARKKTEANAGVYNRIQKKLAAEAVKVSDGIVDIMFQTPEGKTIFGVSEYNYFHNIINQLKKGQLPSHLDPNLNPLLGHSRWLKDSSLFKKLKVKLIPGFKNLSSGKGKDSSKTSEGTLMAIYFQSVLNRKVPIPRTSDKKLMYAVEVPAEAWFKPTDETAVVDYLMEALKMELHTWMLAEKENFGEEIEYMSEKLKGLRLFKTIVPEGVVPEDPEDITQYLSENRGRVEAWLRNQVKMNGEAVREFNLVRETGENIVTELVPTVRTGTQNVQSKTMSKSAWSNYLHEFTYNYIAQTIEVSGMLFGDMAQYKNFDEFFKRTSGAIGTKVMPRVDAENLAWLNQNRPRIDGKARDGRLSVYTYSDPAVTSSLFETISKMFPNNYKKMKEADAQGWISMDGYRDFHLFNTSWSPAMEAAFQRIKEGKALSTEQMGLFGPIKPMYFGPQQNTSAKANAYLKTSLMPLVPDMFTGIGGKKALASLLDDMQASMVDVALVSSGVKHGRKFPVIEGKREKADFYNEDGSINPIIPEGIMTLSWEYFGEQVKVDPGVDERVNFGTQVRKLIWGTMFSNGKAKSITTEGGVVNGAAILKAYKQYAATLESFLLADEEALLAELGIDVDASGDYIFRDYTKTAALIEKEMVRQQYSPNSIVGMREMFSNPTLPKKLDLLPNKREVETLLMSMVKNRVMRQKMPGSMRVLVANTGFETKRENIQTSNDLKFYENSVEVNKDGSVKATQITTRAEIKIPLPTAWIKSIYVMSKTKPTASLEEALTNFNQMIADGKIDERILRKTGYRIPNHGLPATDAFIVKEFLHPSVGNIVIVPSEIVEKAGSDYDIDKLTVFDRNVTINPDGTIEYKSDERGDAENSLMGLMEHIMLAPENYKSLLQPTDPVTLGSLAEKVRNMKRIRKTQTSGLDTLSFTNMIRVSRSLWAGKDGVGIVATHTTSHSLSQTANLGMRGATMPFEGFEPSPVLSLSNEMAVNGENIINNMGLFLNAFVDVSKDDFVIDVNALPDTANLYFFLLRAGVPLKTAVYFMNQPAVDMYLKKLQTLRSEILDGEVITPGSTEKVNKTIAEIQEEITAYFGTDKDVLPILNESDLYKAIDAQDVSSPDAKAFQASVFAHFLKLSQNAELLSNLVQLSNFDTAFAKSMREPEARESQLRALQATDIFENMGAYLDDTIIGGFRKIAGKSTQYYRSLFLSTMPKAEEAISQVAEIIEKNAANYGVTAEDTSRAYKALEDDFTTFLLSTISVDGTYLSDKLGEKMMGKNSLPARLQQASKRPELAENYFIKKVIPELAEFQKGIRVKPDSLRPFSNKFNNAESTALVDGIRELHDLQPTLAKDLIDFFILQAGVGFSPRSLVRAIPFELFLPRAAQVIRNFENNNLSESLVTFPFQFFQNNAHLNGVAPARPFNNYNAFGGLKVKAREGVEPLAFVTNWIRVKVEGQDAVYHRALYAADKIEGGFVSYKRVYEKGDSMLLREYYPEHRASILPINNPLIPTATKGTAESSNETAAPAAAKTPAAPLQAVGEETTNVLVELSTKLSPTHYKWFLKHHGIGAINDLFKQHGFSKEGQEKVITSIIDIARLNCK